MPLHFKLKQFFQSEKKYGSRDRKVISSLCYNYFRCFNLFKNSVFSENHFLNAVFLCEKKETDILNALSPELNERISLSLDQKLHYLGLDASNVFGYNELLSSLIDHNLYDFSFLKQPSLFLRIRPGKYQKVIESIKSAQISFESINEIALKITNGANLDKILQFNKDVVVQDFSSQIIFNDFVQLLKKNEVNNKLSVWDVCAASGGKSILLYDLMKGNIKLTVSDIRRNILNNLDSRLKDAGINIYKKFEQDLTLSSGLGKDEKFDVVICDVPCSGSGTWGRTPEQHFSFNAQQLSSFVEKQKLIVKNAIPHVDENGFFVYFTCSVFKSENEEITNYIQSEFALELIKMNYLKGYENNADTMFTAIFRV